MYDILNVSLGSVLDIGLQIKEQWEQLASIVSQQNFIPLFTIIVPISINKVKKNWIALGTSNGAIEVEDQ